MKRRRPAQPRIRHLGIHAVWTGDSWRFRARSQTNGRRTHGPLRDIQEEASADYREIKAEGGSTARNQIKTLGEGLLAAGAEAKARGVKEITLRCLYAGHGRYLLKFWKPETPLRIFSAKEVAWFIRTALSVDRNPNTLIDHDLKVLRHVFVAAGMKDPIPQAKRITKLKKIPRVIQDIDFMDALQFLTDMRTKDIFDANGTLINLVMRDWHADVCELIMWTGGRSNEIANLKPADIDFHTGNISFNAKVGIRLVPMDDPLAEVLKRLIKAADQAGREYLIPGGMPGVGQILRRWSGRLGVKVNARALRHSIAHGFVGSGLALDRTRDQLGHTNISTTDAYVNPREKRKKQSLEHFRKHVEDLLDEN